jgi:hypothetical protein
MAKPSPLPIMLLLVCMATLGGSQGRADAPAEALSIRERQPIEQVDQVLRAQGWRPDGDPALETYDRELSGNSLASLRGCSGTGAGFCRYDYRRGTDRLEVITVPSQDGDGVVHQWQLESGAGISP